ncbi:hypothetical protein JTB14_014522 [Gonioctena quinquepunctata]|nr:hypothetical protein JTB14_014522 [Gonioctena quinquepunctata]
MCSKKHHVLLHFVRTRQDQELSRSNNNTERDDDPATPNNTGTLQESVETHLCSALTGNNGSNYTNLLSTVVVSVVNSCIPKSTARFILDTGSQANLLTVNFCKKLGLTVSKYFSSVNGLGGNKQSVRGSTTLTIASRYDSSKKYTISALLVKKITDLLPKVCVDISVIPGLAGICLADNNFDKPGEIQGIIGVELFGMILGKHRISGVTSTPVAVETEFGYVVMGKIPVWSREENPLVYFSLQENQSIEHLLTKFWEVEQVPNKPLLIPEEIECDKSYNSTYSRDETGRFTVALPFKISPESLGDSRTHAQFRIDSEGDAIQLYYESINLFKSGGFDLVQWSSNSASVSKNIPLEKRASDTVIFKTDTKMLGIQSNPEKDTFSFEFKTPESKCTKPFRLTKL